MQFKISAKCLKELNRPGAWLLDAVYTMQGILAGEYTSKRLNRMKYDVCSNVKLAALANKVFQAPTSPHSLNNVGNNVEHLAWQLLEADRCDILIAVVWHARNL